MFHIPNDQRGEDGERQNEGEPETGFEELGAPAMRGEHDYGQGRQKERSEVTEDQTAGGTRSHPQPPSDGGSLKSPPGAGGKAEREHGHRHGTRRVQRRRIESGQEIKQDRGSRCPRPSHEWSDQKVHGQGGQRGEDRPKQCRTQRACPGPPCAESDAHGGGARAIEISDRGGVTAQCQIGSGGWKFLRGQPHPPQQSEQSQRE